MENEHTEQKLERVAQVERIQNTRTCLCGETDHRLLMFLSQCMFGVFAGAFFMHQLINKQQTEIYLPLLCSLVGYFMPSPNFGKSP